MPTCTIYIEEKKRRARLQQPTNGSERAETEIVPEDIPSSSTGLQNGKNPDVVADTPRSSQRMKNESLLKTAKPDPVHKSGGNNCAVADVVRSTGGDHANPTNINCRSTPDIAETHEKPAAVGTNADAHVRNTCDTNLKKSRRLFRPLPTRKAISHANPNPALKLDANTYSVQRIGSNSATAFVNYGNSIQRNQNQIQNGDFMTKKNPMRQRGPASADLMNNNSMQMNQNMGIMRHSDSMEGGPAIGSMNINSMQRQQNQIGDFMRNYYPMEGGPAGRLMDDNSMQRYQDQIRNFIMEQNFMQRGRHGGLVNGDSIQWNQTQIRDFLEKKIMQGPAGDLVKENSMRWNQDQNRDFMMERNLMRGSPNGGLVNNNSMRWDQCQIGGFRMERNFMQGSPNGGLVNNNSMRWNQAGDFMRENNCVQGGGPAVGLMNSNSIRRNYNMGVMEEKFMRGGSEKKRLQNQMGNFMRNNNSIQGGPAGCLMNNNPVRRNQNRNVKSVQGGSNGSLMIQRGPNGGLMKNVSIQRNQSQNRSVMEKYCTQGGPAIDSMYNGPIQSTRSQNGGDLMNNCSMGRGPTGDFINEISTQRGPACGFPPPDSSPGTISYSQVKGPLPNTMNGSANPALQNRDHIQGKKVPDADINDWINAKKTLAKVHPRVKIKEKTPAINDANNLNVLASVAALHKDSDADTTAAKNPPPPDGEIILTDKDVLLGRGYRCTIHPGNKLFRQLIEDHRARYVAQGRSKNGKNALSLEIMTKVHVYGGRFLEIVKGSNPEKFAEVPKKRARKKCSQRLREGLPEGSLERKLQKAYLKRAERIRLRKLKEWLEECSKPKSKVNKNTKKRKKKKPCEKSDADLKSKSNSNVNTKKRKKKKPCEKSDKDPELKSISKANTKRGRKESIQIPHPHAESDEYSESDPEDSTTGNREKSGPTSNAKSDECSEPQVESDEYSDSESDAERNNKRGRKKCIQRTNVESDEYSETESQAAANAERAKMKSVQSPHVESDEYTESDSDVEANTKKPWKTSIQYLHVESDEYTDSDSDAEANTKRARKKKKQSPPVESDEYTDSDSDAEGETKRTREDYRQSLHVESDEFSESESDTKANGKLTTKNFLRGSGEGEGPERKVDGMTRRVHRRFHEATVVGVQSEKKTFSSTKRATSREKRPHKVSVVDSVSKCKVGSEDEVNTNGLDKICSKGPDEDATAVERDSKLGILASAAAFRHHTDNNDLTSPTAFHHHTNSNNPISAAAFHHHTDNNDPTTSTASPNVVVPNDKDVLFGRGHKFNIHPGNQRFRELILENRLLYIAQGNSKKKKNALSLAILATVNTYGGRFLELVDKSQPDRFAVVPNPRARKKCSQRFRECVKEHEESQRISRA